MDESLSLTDWNLSSKDEIAALLATAILRKQQRSQHKDPDRLDNSATSCLTVNTPENTQKTTTEVAYE